MSSLNVVDIMTIVVASLSQKCLTIDSANFVVQEFGVVNKEYDFTYIRLNLFEMRYLQIYKLYVTILLHLN